MKKFIVRNLPVCILTIFALSVMPIFSQSQRDYNLPDGAVIIETQPIRSSVHSDRALVLWMLNPKRNPRDSTEEFYTCPELTRGSYYSGATRVSLVNTQTQTVINTIKIDDEDDDSFDIPYLIEGGHYYDVPRATQGKEGKPKILQLTDFNGDGKAQEFALYDSEACMGLATALIGYSEMQDRVIQYPIKLEKYSGGKSTVETLYWIDYLFHEKPVAPGHWQYEIDYRGRGGTLDKYDIRYNVGRERFEGTLISTPGEP